MTPDVETKYFAARRLGNTMSDSARYAGLSPDTVVKWLKRGRGRDPRRPATPPYVRFARMDDEAMAACRVYVVGQLMRRSATDTQAALAWLRVHGGEEWGGEDRGVPGDVSGPPAQITESNVFVVLPREAIPEMVHQLLDGRRREMESQVPKNVTPPLAMVRQHGDSHLADAGLRVDADEDFDLADTD